jgi:hypothetical protein
MGMISPVWEDPDTSLPSGITRVTLFLHDTGSALEVKTRRQQIVQQFQEIEATHLLFLRKIRRIQINFAYGDEENHTITTFNVAESTQKGRITLRKSFDDNSTVETHYHVNRYTAHNIPKSENKTYSESAGTPSSVSTTEIILAFPLDRNSAPIVQTQQIFAFLPIRDMGFKVASIAFPRLVRVVRKANHVQFLIHSDFVTQANRQDIVTTSARNLALVEHIAAAFANAVEELCQDQSLQLEWMKYLPQEDEFPWDSYWKAVIAQMKEKIAVKRRRLAEKDRAT